MPIETPHRAPRTNRDQADRAKQGIRVFSGLGQRDLLASNRLETAGPGWRMLIRNPWYTGTHLSTVTSMRITVNGHPVPEENTLISLRGQTLPIACAKAMHELWWGMGEVAELFLTDPALSGVLAEKNVVNIDIDMRTTFSYGFPDDTLPYRLTGEMEFEK
ncbi:C-glycoside deglycosidase beta subunit domain-containing protein [Umezawaea tangerina]|uniref:C-deglycosylation enzyme beta subunit n=1 Tax=Umezawaea tangerina TaxID=84725 RepID=A0A2T0SZT3_9PSEU|nr:DUF6379 domain-containing protein [Umezawaea tangerina]PRY38928.1 hypothetical protein CLV43_108328 [Umezawaea tangerina]